MKKVILFATAGIIAATTLFSCKKSNTDTTPTDPNTTAQLNYRLKTTNPSAALKTTASTITWTSGFANPTMVKFEAKQGTTEIEYKSTNTAQIDLMSSSAVYFGNFSVPIGTYTEVELKYQLNNNGSSPALELNGQLSTTLLPVPVKVQISGPVELKTEQHNVTFTNKTSVTGAATIDLSMLTSGLTEAMLLSASVTSGTIVISATSNTALYNTILSNLRNRDHHFEFEHH